MKYRPLNEVPGPLILRFLLLVLMISASAVSAQPQPAHLSIFPSAINLGESYTVTILDAAFVPIPNITIDVQFRLDEGPIQTTLGYFTTDQNGQFVVGGNTFPGVRRATAIRNTLNSKWKFLSTGLPQHAVNVRQPTGRLTVGANGLRSNFEVLILRGNFFRIQVAGWPKRSVEFRYQVDGGPVETDQRFLNSDAYVYIPTSASGGGLAGELGKIHLTGYRLSNTSAWNSADAYVEVLEDCPTSSAEHFSLQQCDAQRDVLGVIANFAQAPTEAQIKEALTRSFRSYTLRRLDPAVMRKEVLATGRTTLVLDGVERRLILEPNDMRSPSLKKAAIEAGKPEPMSTFKGWVAGVPDSQVRLSLHPELVMGMVRLGEDRVFIDPLYKFVPGSGADRVVFYRQQDLMPQPGITCGLEELKERAAATSLELADDLPALPPTELLAVKSSPRVIEIAIEADGEYSQLHADPVAHMEAILNMVEGEFEDANLDLTYSITHEVAWPDPAVDPYDSCDIVGLWCELRDQFENHQTTVQKDLGHLFSAKRVSHNYSTSDVLVRGIGQVGSVCAGLAKEYALTTNYREVGLVAHEQGHTLGALHVDEGNNCPGIIPAIDCPDEDCLTHQCSPGDPSCQVLVCPDPNSQGGYIMCLSIQSPIEGYSTCARDAINGHLAAQPNCLAP